MWLEQREGEVRREVRAGRDGDRARGPRRLWQGPFVSRGQWRVWKGGVMGHRFGGAGVSGETGLTKVQGCRLPTAVMQGRDGGGLDRLE